MNISTKLENEVLDPQKEENGYEWWYFDAISAGKDWSLVIIFYHGNPFSTKYLTSAYGKNPGAYPAISISIYRKGKPEFYSFQEYSESNFLWEDDNEPMCVIGACSFKRYNLLDEIEYEIQLNQVLDSGHTVSGKLKFLAKKASPKLFKKSKDRVEHHHWDLMQPHAKVVGSVKIKGKTDSYHIGFHGDGYHDHNRGVERLSYSFKEWYWGRLHFENETLLYYVMNGFENKQHQAWLISRDNQQVLSYFDKIELQNPAKNRFGLKYFQELHFMGVRGTIEVHQKKRVDNGPFYQRFLAEAFYVNANKKPVVTGFSEYIYPKNIEDEKYRWMVNMRLRYTRQKPHWVQKSRLLYPFTW